MRIVAITIVVSLLAVSGWYLAASSSSDAESAPASSHATATTPPTTTVAPSTTAAPMPKRLTNGQRMLVHHASLQTDSAIGSFAGWQKGCQTEHGHAAVIACYKHWYSFSRRLVDAAMRHVERLSGLASGECAVRLQQWRASDGPLVRYAAEAGLVYRQFNRHGKAGGVAALKRIAEVERADSAAAVTACT